MCTQKAKIDQLINERQDERTKQIDALKTALQQRPPGDKQEWIEIEKLNFCQLADSLQKGLYTPTTVLRAYQNAALRAHEQTNCVTMFLDDALEIAEKLERDYSDGQPKPALYGIPISVKEQLEIAGLDVTFGYGHRINTPLLPRTAACINAAIVCGCVPFVRTNTPQALISFNCSNPVYGLSTHPMNKARTPGGSSGGEAALLGCGGAPLGLGTDGGGSIRIPGSFCGLAGIKPTSTRVSQKGVGANIPGMVVLGVSWGPMCPTVDGLVSLMRATLNTDSMSRDDVYFCRVPFNEDEFKSARPLRIGWYNSNGLCEPVPAMKRAVLHVKSLLEKQGHEFVDWQPPSVEHSVGLFARAFLSDAGAQVLKWSALDRRDPYLSTTYTGLKMPHFIAHTIAFLVQPFFRRLALALRTLTTRSSEVSQSYADTFVYRQKVIDEWAQHRLDAVLCPVFAHPACTHKFADDCNIGAMYPALYNLLDFTAGTVPVTHVTLEDEKECAAVYPAHEDFWAKAICTQFSNDTIGLPVGVQLVALPNQEEKLLRLMKEVEELLLEHSPVKTKVKE